MHEPSDAEMWRSVEVTVRNVLLPSLADDWARVAAIQLVGMARFAASRPPDPTPARTAELAATLDRLAAHPVVAANWTGSSRDPAAVFTAVSNVLAATVAAEGGGGADGSDGSDSSLAAVRAELRPIVRRHLDDDLAVTGMLMPYFRGQLPDA